MKDFVIKYKVHILIGGIFFLFFRGCGKTISINKLEKSEAVNIEVIDSLNNVINLNNARLDSIPEVIRNEKLSVYLSLDDTISRVDRTPQLMGFHALIKDKIKDLQDD